jgi:hypothetical protein
MTKDRRNYVDEKREADEALAPNYNHRRQPLPAYLRDFMRSVYERRAREKREQEERLHNEGAT